MGETYLDVTGREVFIGAHPEIIGEGTCQVADDLAEDFSGRILPETARLPELRSGAVMPGE